MTDNSEIVPQNGLAIFSNNNFGSIRVLEKDGEPWFVGIDVAKALGYADPNDAVRHHCKKVNNFNTGESRAAVPGPNYIPESDLYRLILRSHMPKAEEFQDWIVEDVLPSIRKTGKYGANDKPALPSVPLQDKIALLKQIMNEVGIVSKNMRLLILDEFTEKHGGFSLVESLHIDLAKESGEPVFSMAEMAKLLEGGHNEWEIKCILADMGLFNVVDNTWYLTEEGKKYGKELEPGYVGRGRCRKFTQRFFWKPIVMDKIRLRLGQVFVRDNDYPLRHGEFTL